MFVVGGRKRRKSSVIYEVSILLVHSFVEKLGCPPLVHLRKICVFLPDENENFFWIR
jgi:hypothetical protein